MTFAAIIEDAAANPTQVRVCSAGDPPDLTDRFGARNVAVEYTALPTGAEGFAVVRRGEEFVGSVPLTAFDVPADPPTGPLGARDGDADDGFRTLLGLLDDTVFTSMERDQMVATSHEIEDRAWRLGNGRLSVGFQSFSAMHAEADAYRRLAAKPDLDVELFAAPNGGPPSIDGATVRTVDDPEIAEAWFVVYDADDRCNSCALLAVERDPDSYRGFWTYDAERVDEIVLSLRRATGRVDG